MSKFDPNEYKKGYEQIFGKGSFDAGMKQARQIGQLKVQAAQAKKDYTARLRAQQAAEKKAQKAADEQKTVYGGMTAKEAESMQKKAQAEGRGGYQPSYSNARKEARKNSKDEGLSPYTSTPSNYDSSKLTDYAKQKLGFLPSWDQPKKKNDKKSGLGGLLDKFKKSEVGKTVTAAEQFFNPFDNVSADKAVNNFLHHKQSKATKEIQRGANRLVDSTSLGLMSNLDKKVNKREPYYNSPRKLGEGGGTDMITSGLGYLVPGVGATKAVKALGLGAKEATGLAKLGQLAKEGAITGGALTGGQTGINYALNPKDQSLKNNLENIGLGIGLGAVGDPLLHGLGGVASKQLGKLAKGEVPTYTGKPSQNVLDALKPKSTTDVLKPLAPKSDVKLPQSTEKGLQAIAKPTKQYTSISSAPRAKTPGMLPPSELDNHGYGLIDLKAEAKQNKVSPVLLDQTRQSQGNLETLRAKIDDVPKKNHKGLFNNLRTQFIDDAAPAGKLEKNITGNIASAENSLYKQARLFKGSPEKAHLIVQEQLYPIFNEMDKSGINYKDLREYALAVHAKDVNAKGINSGLTNAEINDAIEKLGSPKMEELRQKLVGVNDHAMKILSSGEKPVLDPVQVADLKQKWPNYMSLFRSFDDEKVNFANGVSKSMANVTNPLKKLEGSDKRIIDPMESLVKNLFKAVNTSDRNQVASQIGKLAEKDTEGNFIKRLADNEDTSRLNVISVMNKGKKEKYEVPPEVYRMMMNLDKESTNTLVKILQKPASTLRAGATLTPEFSLRNPLRDIPNAFVTSKSGFNPVVDFPVGLWQSIWKGRTIKIGNKEFKTSGELYKQFIKENGGYGNIISMDRNLHQKLLKQALTEHNQHYVDVLDPKTYVTLMKKFKNPLNILRNVADVSETATKVGEFRAALRSGTSPQEAAYRARDLMDFARAGTSVREANKVVAFLNANIQGKSKLIRAFSENPAKFAGKAVAAVTLPTIGEIVAQNTYANDKQKAIINDAPRWLKDTFYLIPIPETNQIARIPKPFDLAFAFSNTVERAFEFVAKHDKHAFDGFIKDGFSQASIPVMLTGLAPIVEGMANYSFFKQGPIIPKREVNINYPDQYDINTSETAKFVGKGINSLTGGDGAFKNFGSPRVVDNTIQGFTGGTGTYATSIVDWLLNSTGAVNRPAKPAKTIDQKPLARAFLVNQSSSGDSLDKLYTLKEKLTKARGSANQNHVPFKQEMEYQTVNQATKALSKINTQIRLIENAPGLSAEQKRSMLDTLIQSRNTFSRQVMQRINE